MARRLRDNVPGPDTFLPKQVVALADDIENTIGAGAGVFWPESFGAAGDGVTDDTAAFQATIDAVAAAGGGVISLAAKTYIIAGALADTSLSNSQLVLPKVGPSGTLIAIRFLGVVAGQPWPSDSDKGTIIRSTLATGSGAMIGCRANNGSGTGSQNQIAHNAMSWISFQAENIIFRSPANPTNSCLDFRFIPNLQMRNCRIDVMNVSRAILSGVIPDITCTEPTTSTSYGLLAPIEFMPNLVMLENIEIAGYYNGMRWGELVTADNLTFACCKVAIEMRGAAHGSKAGTLLFVTCKELIKALGSDPFLTSVNTNVIDVQQMAIENSSGTMAWSTTTSHINDPNNYLIGDIKWASIFAPLKVGGANLKMHQTNKPWHTVRPFTDIIGTDLDTVNHAVDETYRGLAVSNDTGVAWKVMTNHQSGTANVIGVLAYVNDAIANGLEKRLGQIALKTEGGINSGKLSIYTMEAGVLIERAAWDKYGNFIQVGINQHAEGAALTITSNTIAPTHGVHVVGGAGPLKTITLPPGINASFEIDLVPSAAWTYDNTANIGGGGGTAVIGRVMTARWIPSLSKWFMTY